MESLPETALELRENDPQSSPTGNDVLEYDIVPDTESSRDTDDESISEVK